MMKIKVLNTFPNDQLEKIIEQVKNIFYLSSSIQTFSSEERRDAFFKRWCGDYITLFPEQFFIMEEDGKVLGYLSGCQNSKLAESLLAVPGFNVFCDLFEEYQAHFHINFHPDCRGRGLGSVLVESYCENLLGCGIRGVHLVTSPSAANISFYRKLKFNDEVERPFNQTRLLFMGKKTGVK